MITVDQVDLSRDLQAWQDAVARRSDKLGTTMEEEVKTQAGLLMRELVKRLPPKSKASLEKQIAGDAKKVFADDKIWFRKKQQGKDGEMIWMRPGPNSLTGIERAMVIPSANAAQMSALYKEHAGKMGKKYQRIGSRGKQAVRKINRFMVKPAELKRFQRLQHGKVGKLKASIAMAWNHLAVKGARPAAWIMRHVESQTARGSYVDGLHVKDRPSFEIVSNQGGCTSQEALKTVAFVMRQRAMAMLGDLTRKLKHMK